LPPADASAVPRPALRELATVARERLALCEVVGLARLTVGPCTTTGGSADAAGAAVGVAVCANDFSARQRLSAIRLVVRRIAILLFLFTGNTLKHPQNPQGIVEVLYRSLNSPYIDRRLENILETILENFLERI
jgi:hypothetical protein